MGDPPIVNSLSMKNVGLTTHRSFENEVESEAKDEEVESEAQAEEKPIAIDTSNIFAYS